MIPPPALAILELIRLTETSRADGTAYDTIYGHKESKLTKPITKMTIDELQGHQAGFTKAFGSSASGAYQFMKATLGDLKQKLSLTGQEIFTPALQDQLGFELLRRRGYTPWVEGRSSTDVFMVGLAKEWASFPVPSDMQGAHRRVLRGQSFYAGDGLNKALARPDAVWLACEAARTLTEIPLEPEPVPKPEEPAEVGDQVVLTPEQWRHAIETFTTILTSSAVRDALLAAMTGESHARPPAE